MLQPPSPNVLNVKCKSEPPSPRPRQRCHRDDTSPASEVSEDYFGNLFWCFWRLQHNVGSEDQNKNFEMYVCLFTPFWIYLGLEQVPLGVLQRFTLSGHL